MRTTSIGFNDIPLCVHGINSPGHQSLGKHGAWSQQDINYQVPNLQNNLKGAEKTL